MLNLPVDNIILALIHDYLDYRTRYQCGYSESVATTTNFFAHWRDRHLNIKKYNAADQSVCRSYIKEIYSLLDGLCSGTAHSVYRLTDDGVFGWEIQIPGRTLPIDYFENRTLSIKTHMNGVIPQCFLVSTTIHSVKH